MPNANEDNIKLINELTEEYYQNVLAYKNQSIDFDTYRLNESKYQGILGKLTNFKDYVLDKAEGEEPDFSLIRQTEGDVNKWGRDKAFSYGAQGFKLIVGDDGSVGFQHAAIDFDKFKDKDGVIDFSLIDPSKSDSYKTISTDIDELFSDKNGFAPTIKYDYSQDAQFFRDTISFLNKEAPRYAKGVDNGYAIFTEADKERFKNEIVIPKIDDNIIKARGLQIYEDILGNVGQWNPDDPTQIAAVKNELANQLINKMPSTFGKLQQTGTGKGKGSDFTSTKYFDDFTSISNHIFGIVNKNEKAKKALQKRNEIMNNPDLTQEQKTQQTYGLLSDMMGGKKLTIEDAAEALRTVGVQAYTKDDVIARFDPETEDGAAAIKQINNTKSLMYVQIEGGKFKPLISFRGKGDTIEELARAYGETLPAGQLTKFNEVFGKVFGPKGNYQSSAGNYYDIN